MNDQAELSGKPSIFGTQGAAAAEAPSEQEIAEARSTARDLSNDMMSVLIAATSPLSLLAIQDELNAPGRGDHVPTGPIDRLLDDWTGGDRPRVVVVKLGDPLVEHYQLSPTYRAEVESPGLVIEKRAAILGAIFAPDGLDEEGEGNGLPLDQIVEVFDERKVRMDRADLEQHVGALMVAGVLVAIHFDQGTEHERLVYVLAKGVPARILTEGAPAVAKSTLPAKEAPQPDAAAEAQAVEQRQIVERYVAELNCRLEEQERRAVHFQGEAMRFAQKSAKYEQWARRGGFNIAEITGQVDAQARGQGVPWVALRMVDERELRRLLTEEDKINEALAASRKSFESAKRAYEATKSQLEEKLALVKQAQRSTSYAPDKMVRRIVRDFQVEVVSDDAHDYGMHLDWEELRDEDRQDEAEPEVVVAEPPAKVVQAAPPQSAAQVGTGGTGGHPGVTSTVSFGASAGSPPPVVQVMRREDGTTDTDRALSMVPAEEEDRRLPEGKQYAGKLSVKEMADNMSAIFLNEEYGLRFGDVQPHFEATHGALPEGGDKLIEPTLRFLEGRGSLLSGVVPGPMPTSEPVKLFWHSSFKDPRTAPPPAPTPPKEKPTRKAREKAVVSEVESAPAEASESQASDAKPARKSSKKKAAAK